MNCTIPSWHLRAEEVGLERQLKNSTVYKENEITAPSHLFLILLFDVINVNSWYAVFKNVSVLK